MTEMMRLKSIGPVLLAVFVLSAVATSAAQAEEAPFWAVGGARLGAGQTRFIAAKEAKAFVLSGAGVTVTCTSASVVAGAVILGSAAGEPGTDDETLDFSSCKVEGNDKTAECEKVTEPIATRNLKSELVLDKTKAKLLTLFQPASGLLLAELKFPSGCKITTDKVTGSFAAEALNEKEEAITTSSEATQYKTGFLRFPSTQPVDIWLIKGSVGKEVELKALETNALPATLSGTAAISLESGEEFAACA
jgi:hypothetical protein